MNMTFRIPTAFCAVLALAGCASRPNPPPEPDMSHLVPINSTMPSELVGKAVLPVKTPAQQWKAGDAR
ncbi:hypothetical protein [Caballeronia telluris]|uniref:hypothetical protein n=1 Tax=Caballeronia telluris TaxID=326475 RepID=UPI00389909B5